MNDNPSHGGEPARLPGRESFGVMLAAVFGGNAPGVATIVGLAGVILALPARRLGLPFLALLLSGVVLAPWLHSARLTRHRPKACALRLAIGVFSYLLVLSAGALFGAIWIGLLSPRIVLYDIYPVLFAFWVLLSPGFYFLALQNLKDTQHS